MITQKTTPEEREQLNSPESLVQEETMPERASDRPWGSVVCIAAFVIQFITFGQHNCSGIVFAGLLAEYGSTRMETALIPSLSSGTKLTFGPLAGFLCERCGCRVTVLLGGVTCAVGLLASSFCSRISYLYITYGVVWGLGTGLCHCASLVMVSRYFTRRLALANGLVALGSAVGALVLSPTFEYLIETFGIKATFKILSALQIVVILCGLVYRPYQDKNNIQERTRKFCHSSLFQNKAYVIWVISMAIYMLAYLLPYIHLVRLAQDSGIKLTKAAFLASFTAIGSTVGRPFFGWMLDKLAHKRLQVFQLSLLCVSVSTTLVPLLSSYPWLASYALLYGFLEGCLLVVLPVVTTDITGKQEAASALGNLFFVLSFPITAGPALAGWIYDEWESYTVPFIVAGAIVTMSTCLLFLIPWFLVPNSTAQQVSEQVHIQLESRV